MVDCAEVGVTSQNTQFMHLIMRHGNQIPAGDRPLKQRFNQMRRMSDDPYAEKFAYPPVELVLKTPPQSPLARDVVQAIPLELARAGIGMTDLPEGVRKYGLHDDVIRDLLGDSEYENMIRSRNRDVDEDDLVTKTKFQEQKSRHKSS
jgi:hypothetical protein